MCMHMYAAHVRAAAAVLEYQNSLPKAVSKLVAEVKQPGATCGSVRNAVLAADSAFVPFEPEGDEAEQAWERLASKSSDPRLLADANMFRDIVHDGKLLLGVSLEALSKLIGAPCGDAGEDATRAATELTELTNATELTDALEVRTVPHAPASGRLSVRLGLHSAGPQLTHGIHSATTPCCLQDLQASFNAAHNASEPAKRGQFLERARALKATHRCTAAAGTVIEEGTAAADPATLARLLRATDSQLAQMSQDEKTRLHTHIDTSAVKALAESVSGPGASVYTSFNLTARRDASARSMHRSLLTLWGDAPPLPLHDSAPATTAAQRTPEAQHEQQVCVLAPPPSS